MRRLTRIALGILATIGGLYILMALLVPLLVDRTCTTYPVLQVASPTGKWQAEQVQETCNDDNRTRVVVWISEDRSVNVGGKKWSAFRADASQPTSTPGVFQPLRLQIVWLSDSELQITYPSGTDVAHSERSDFGVRVRYQEMAESFR